MHAVTYVPDAIGGISASRPSVAAGSAGVVYVHSTPLHGDDGICCCVVSGGPTDNQTE